jgi:hypothetical protein
MIAPRPGQSARRRRYSLSPATTWLIRAFAPGCPTLLRSQATVRVRGPADRLTIIYDLPDGKARLRADQLAKGAAALKLVAIGSQVIRDIDVAVSDDRDLLSVDVLLVRK